MAKIKKPLLKKAQGGTSVSQDKKGNYYYTKKVTTKNGPRYYQGVSPDYNMAESEANFKAKRMPQDSTRKATLLPYELKKMDEKKKGGVIKKMQTGGTTVSTQTLSKESEKERQKNNRYNSKYKSSFKTLTSTSNSSGNTTSYSQQKGKNDKIKEKEYFLSKDSTGNAMGQVTKNDKMRIINGKPAENKMKRILKRNTTSSGELLKKGGVIKKKMGGTVKKMQTGGKIEEQYQKQKKVTSKQAEMDKIKTPYPKTTLKKAVNSYPLDKAVKNAGFGEKKATQSLRDIQRKSDPLRSIEVKYNETGNRGLKKGGVVKKTIKPVVKKIVKSIKKKK